MEQYLKHLRVMTRFDNINENAEISEGNKLWRNVERPLQQGRTISTVSYERGGMSKQDKDAARERMETDLQRLRQSGAIEGFKKAKGRYTYTTPNPDELGIGAERSYVVGQSTGPKAKYFDKLMKALGKRYGQESIGRVDAGRRATYQYMKKNRVVDKGTIQYNLPLGSKTKEGQEVTGDTNLKGQTFTFTKE